MTGEATVDFWGASGHHLLDRDDGGRLVVTDAFLQVYLARPEVLPPDDACDAERVLHASLMREPRRPVAPEEVAALADADARENWAFLLAFRDHLLAAPTLEAAYLALVDGRAGRTPPIFIDQLAQLVVRAALDGCAEPMVLRAGELFFRPQVARVREGVLLLADAETVARAEHDAHHSPLLAMFAGPAEAQLGVVEGDDLAAYAARSDAFDLVLPLGQEAARRALATAMEAWLHHLRGLAVRITPMTRIKDDAWAWFVGLDAEATRLGDALWRGEGLPEEAQSRILALFRLDIDDVTAVIPALAGRPTYLMLAADRDGRVRMKPQNLALGLPLARQPSQEGRAP